MKHRRVFSTSNISVAQAAVAAARAAGVKDEDISLVARSDIELDWIPKERLDASMDVVPAAVRGVAEGGGAGLVAGLIAVAIPPLGITVAGVALLTAAGAMVGGWSSALMGSAIPSEVRRRFEDEIEAGRILIVVDADEDALPAVEPAIASTGAEPRPYDTPSALT